MKRLFILLIAVVAVATGAKAQKMNLSVSYGGYTLMDAADYHDGWNNVKSAWGALNIGFNVQLMPKLWVGPSYTFSSTSTKGNYSSDISYHAIMINGRYDYYSNRLLTVYARAGVGAEISHMQPYDGDSYNKGYFAFQLSPVGVDVQLTPMFTMFGEAGFGAQGILQVGVRLNL